MRICSTHLNFVFAIALIGCKDYGTDQPQTDAPIPYYLPMKYAAYDMSGAVSTTGFLYFTINNSRVTGVWKFDDGREGTLLGTSSHGTMQMELYPDYADHNLILTGTMTFEEFSREWVMYGWAILGRGRFVATVNHVILD